MKKYLILIILISNFCFGQSESRQNFVISLNVPDNERNSHESFKNIATDNNIKRIKFYEGKEIVEDLLFDKKGNVIEATDKSNKVISKTKFEFDKQNRLTEISFFMPNGDFKYGYKYIFNGPYRTEFKIGDSLPTKRIIELKEENITIYSDLNANKEWELHSVIFQNGDKSYDRELRYNKDGLYQEFKYFYNPLKQEGGTKSISYNNGVKISEKDYSAYKTDKNGNRIERYSAYSTDTLKLISTHKFNDKNKILENDYPTKLENFEYDKNGLIIKKTIKDRNGITILNFYYKSSLPEKIVELKGKKETTFRYEYEYY